MEIDRQLADINIYVIYHCSSKFFSFVTFSNNKEWIQQRTCVTLSAIFFLKLFLPYNIFKKHNPFFFHNTMVFRIMHFVV